MITFNYLYIRMSYVTPKSIKRSVGLTWDISMKVYGAFVGTRGSLVNPDVTSVSIDRG